MVLGTNYQSNPLMQFGSNALIDLGYGLTKGHNFNEALGYATENTQRQAPYRDQEAQRQAQIAETTEQKNKTIQTMLEAGREDLANMAEAGQMAQAWKLFAQAQQPGGGATMGLSPIWGQDADGNPVIGQLSNQGGMQVVQPPEGVTFGKDPIKLDAGTHFVLLDPVTRQQVGVIPKENERAAFDTATGTGLGKVNAENITAADSLASKMPGLQQVVSELGDLAEKATYTQAGKLWDDIMRETGQMPSEGALARTKYMAMVDNQVLPLLRDTFGAAFTVQEGESLRATLGAPDKSPAEKKAVLEAFINQKVRDLQAMQSRVGGGAAPGGGVDDILSEYGL